MFAIDPIIMYIRKSIRYKNLKKRFETYLRENEANMNPLMLIKSNELQISDKKLGGGEFGNVYSGRYITKNGKYKVAIKILKGVEEQELIQESGIMAQLDHPHLTKLIGISLAENIKIVTPLRPLGSLEDFIKNQKNKLQSEQLLLYCYQIASGMEYLISKKILHRDLATRNILVHKRDHVEVTDFGLSAVLHQNLALPSRMPYRWIAMEILNQPREKSLYTEASDIWSFGVTCWEILTYAQVPYGNVRLDGPDILKSLFTYLQNGNRLVRPENCSLELYQALLLCWAPKPITRLNFKSLREKFEEYNKDPDRYVTVQRKIREDFGVIETGLDQDNYFGYELKSFYEGFDKVDTKNNMDNTRKNDKIGMELQKSDENEYKKISFLKKSSSYSSYLSILRHKNDEYDTPKRSHSYRSVKK